MRVNSSLCVRIKVSQRKLFKICSGVKTMVCHVPVVFQHVLGLGNENWVLRKVVIFKVEEKMEILWLVAIMIC